MSLLQKAVLNMQSISAFDSHRTDFVILCSADLNDSLLLPQRTAAIGRRLNAAR
jgi:hypothetical protein